MNCKNCHTSLQEQDDFCRSCGGKVIRKRLTFRNLFEHLSETFFNYDNKLLRTFIHLFTQPKLVIDGYINGMRKRYVNPISFFGVSLTLSGLSIFLLKKFYLKYLDFSSVFNNEAFNNEMSKQIMEGSSNSAFEYSSLIYSATIPFMAIMSFIIFLNKRYNLTEHVILYLYSMSAASICSVFVGTLILLTTPENYVLFTLLFYVFLLIYHMHVLKQVFNLSIGQLLLKTFLFLILFFVLYVVVSIIIAIVMFATGAVNIEDFAPK